jgi:hypothetical protein
VSFGLRPVVRALDMLAVVERGCCGCGCEVCFVVGERVGAAQVEGKLKAACASLTLTSCQISTDHFSLVEISLFEYGIDGISTDTAEILIVSQWQPVLQSDMRWVEDTHIAPNDHQPFLRSPRQRRYGMVPRIVVLAQVPLRYSIRFNGTHSSIMTRIDGRRTYGAEPSATLPPISAAAMM